MLLKLGYAKNNGVYLHPNRKVLFVGDYIDRGPKIKETLEIIKAMVDNGNIPGKIRALYPNSLMLLRLHPGLMNSKEKRTQCLDLFCFKNDDWFFCEVKGKGDCLSREQSEYFRNIGQVSQKEIRVLRIDRQPTVSDFHGYTI